MDITYTLGMMLVCLLLTIILEGGLAIILKYRGVDLLYIILVNILTNPLLNALTVAGRYYFGNAITKRYVYIAEVVIVLIEGFIYLMAIERRKINPLILSLILNCFSYICGLIIFSFI